MISLLLLFCKSLLKDLFIYLIKIFFENKKRIDKNKNN